MVKYKKDRRILAYVGTDHAITEPKALSDMQSDNVSVHIMERYHGLLYNIEFAVAVRSKSVPIELKKWADAVATGSTELTDDLLRSYELERQKFENNRAKAKATTFTWGRKREPGKKTSPRVAKGDLIVEVMPKETGLDGAQLQLPMEAAEDFFGLKGSGDTMTVKLQSVKSKDINILTMTIFANNTVRVSIRELEYRDRPCVIVFRKAPPDIIKYEIVAQSIFPTRYKMLLDLCVKQTRSGSRHWVIA